MFDAIVWLAILELLGLLAFPFVFLALRFLPDRGYSLSKVAGVLFVSYLLWLGASLHVIPNERWSIILIIAALSAASAALAWRRRGEMGQFVSQRRSLVIAVEALFVVAFATALVLRSYVDEFQEASGEKPMNNAFINAVLRADYFPPEDPWLAGHDLNYYYFGHVTVATVTKLSGIPSYVTFNLALAMISALSAVSAFGLGYSLVAGRVRFATAAAVGFLGTFLLLILSNIEGLFELLAVQGIGSSGFYDLIDIKGLDGPRDSPDWYPTEFLWLLRAINFVTGEVDRQFPFYKLMQGEVHSETLAIPFVLLALGAALNFWRAPPGDTFSWRGGAWPLLFAALALGSLIVTQTWYAPVFYLMLVAALTLKAYRAERRLSRAFARQALPPAALLALAAVLLFLPFFRTSFSAFGGIVIEGEIASRPHHLLYMWLPLFWLAGSFVVVSLAGRPPERSAVIATAGLPLAVVSAWALLLAAGAGSASLPDAIKSLLSDGRWLSLLVLAGLLGATLLALRRNIRELDDAAGPPAAPFALALIAVALLVLLGVELFSVEESRFPRLNTLVKGNYSAWFLLSIGAAFGAYYVFTAIRTPAGKAAWTTVTALILATGLMYPVLTTASYTAAFEHERHISLLWKWERYAPGEYEAVRWLNDNVEGTPTIVEAVGDSWSRYARVSAYTGLPAVVGWPGHETHWRGDATEPEARREAVRRIYETVDPGEAKGLLDRYEVEYVYVGQLERDAYGEAGLGKFGGFMEVAFSNAEVTIYRMADGAAAVAGR